MKNGSANKNGSMNKNGSANKNIGRIVGSMRNPPTVFFSCEDGIEEIKRRIDNREIRQGAGGNWAVDRRVEDAQRLEVANTARPGIAEDPGALAREGGLLRGKT